METRSINAFTNQRTTDDTGGCCANSSESVNRVGQSRFREIRYAVRV